MTEYIIWIALVSLWCWGFHNAFQEEQIFDSIGIWLRRRIPEFWLKPLISCPICMCSIHGTAWYLISQPNWSLSYWIMFIVAASGLNYVIHNLFPPTDIDVKNHY